MSTAVKVWLLFPQIVQNASAAGRYDIVQRVESLQQKYRNGGQLWDNPQSDLPRYREFLKAGEDILNYVSKEGETTPALVKDVDFRFLSSCYARLIAVGLQGETIAGGLGDHFAEDGKSGERMFNKLLDKMKKAGLDSGELRHAGYKASLGSNNPFERQLAEKKKAA